MNGSLPGVDSILNSLFNTSMANQHPDARLINRLGGSAIVAERLGYSVNGGVQRVDNWKRRGIPIVIRLRRVDIFGPAPVEKR